MLDAIVQFLRNALCCIKDLGLLQDTFLWDNQVTLQYYDLPEPLNKTMPLEVFISIFQAYAFCSASTSGYSLMIHSIGKLRRIRRLQRTQSSLPQNDAARLVQASLMNEAKFAMRSILVGILVFLIGISFLWLTANSWHVTETMWLGGLKGLIYALSVNETCLLILLMYMFKDGRDQLQKVKRMQSLLGPLKDPAWKDAPSISLASLEALTGWLPFWDSGIHPLEDVDETKETKQLEAELGKVSGLLRDLTKSTKRQEIAEDLQVSITVTRLEGYREFLYLLINAIAFYGYFLGILVYFFPGDSAVPTPPWVRHLMFQWDHAVADWRGNFAGDACWTLEPLIILASPVYLSRLRESRTKKLKSD